MGIVHERLQAINEALKLEEEVKRVEEEQQRLVREQAEVKEIKAMSEIACNEEERRALETPQTTPDGEARRLQFEKYLILRESGLLDMLADATQQPSPSIEPDYVNIGAMQRLQTHRTRDEWDNYIFGQKKEWVWTINQVEFWKKSSELNSNLDIRILYGGTEYRGEKSSRLYHVPERQVDIHFDGAELIISGDNTVFSGPIPSGQDKQQTLEDAVVEAFTYPRDVSAQYR